MSVYYLKPRPPSTHAPRRARYRDGNNYCDWCGQPLETFERRYCEDECAESDLADARKTLDADRVSRLAPLVSNRKRARQGGVRR